jgi:hypothetical protein
MKKNDYILILSLLLISLSACSAKPIPIAAPTPVADVNGYLAPNENGFLAPSAVPDENGYLAPSTPSGDIPQTNNLPNYLPPLPAGALLQVVYGDNQSKVYTLDALKKLPSISITSGSTQASGPKLSTLLVDAGINDYQQVTVLSGNNSSILNKDKINDQIIIGLSSDGSAFLVTPDQPADKWLKNIDQIQVK